MMTDSKNKTSPAVITEPFDLATSLAALKTPEEVSAFLDDLCTPGELHAMSERWRAVQLVFDEVPYRKICEMTGVSTATVTRVARALHEGSGYRTLITRLRRRKS